MMGMATCLEEAQQIDGQRVVRLGQTSQAVDELLG